MLATRILLFAALLLIANPTAADTDPRLQAHIDVLRQHGRPPLEFVIDTLDDVDLIVFDDAWHPCSEPWEFYRDLVTSPDFRSKAKYVFVEVFPINKQPDVDAYLRSDPEDVTLLYPALQDDLSGTGWPLESYLDLMHAIWEVNRGLPEGATSPVAVVDDGLPTLSIPQIHPPSRPHRAVTPYRESNGVLDPRDPGNTSWGQVKARYR